MTTTSRTKSKGNRTHITVDGKKFTIQHVTFDSEVKIWRKFSDLLEDKYNSTQEKSYVMRLLVTAVVYGLIDLDQLDSAVVAMSKEKGEDTLL